MADEKLTFTLDTGDGEPFAPAGKVFSEWVAVLEPDEPQWRRLLREGVDFVG